MVTASLGILLLWLSTCPNKAHPPQASGSKKSRQNVKDLVQRVGVPSISYSPAESLVKGNWVKLICGASFEDVVDIRNLSLVYTLAGVDCIDCAADASVVSAVIEGIEAAREIIPLRSPWVMVSVNFDEDLHFRKAEFNPENCPLDCSRPCENVCPANAILFERETSRAEVSYPTSQTGDLKSGVITERCYGCGRCFPVCPYDKIGIATYRRDTADTAELLRRNDVDAIEIHSSASFTDNAGSCGIPGLPPCQTHLSAGVKVGIGFGVPLCLVFVVVCFICWRKRRQNILRANNIAEISAPYA